jgi:iron-sulfur cluster assembly accessory protein
MITLTDAAKARFLDVLAQTGQPHLLLRVEKKGCGGLTYLVEPTDTDQPDRIAIDEGHALMIDPSAFLYALGLEIDWQSTPFSGELVFTNPSATGTCGCGKSFSA